MRARIPLHRGHSKGQRSTTKRKGLSCISIQNRLLHMDAFFIEKQPTPLPDREWGIGGGYLGRLSTSVMMVLSNHNPCPSPSRPHPTSSTLASILWTSHAHLPAQHSNYIWAQCVIQWQSKQKHGCKPLQYRNVHIETLLNNLQTRNEKWTIKVKCNKYTDDNTFHWVISFMVSCVIHRLAISVCKTYYLQLLCKMNPSCQGCPHRSPFCCVTLSFTIFWLPSLTPAFILLKIYLS